MEQLVSHVFDVLTYLKVKLIKRVVLTGDSGHVVSDAAVFEATSGVGPAISCRLFIDGELNCNADRLHDFVAEAGATFFICTFDKDPVLLTVILRSCPLLVLLPEGEIKASLGVLLLPSELFVLCQLADRGVLDREVAIDNLPVSFCGPVKVQAEWFGVTKRNGVLAQMELGEVVLHIIGGEEVLGDGIVKVIVVFVCPLGRARLRCHEQ